MHVVIALGHDGLGHGDHELGQRVLTTFLRKAPAIRGLSAILLYNSGVRLAAEGSSVLVELTHLHEAGVDVRPCATCVDHFGLREKIAVGGISSMDEIVSEMNRADKVISL
ncbi:MAG: DsrE family protein [Phycisphaerae bacterium]